MKNIAMQIEQLGVVPVIKIDDASKAVALGNALVRGGIPAAEITFRTQAGEEAIALMASQCPDVLVGAGTILTIAQCDRAIAAGAQFIVSPGYDEALVAHCQKKGVLILPGCTTPSDISKAVNAGLEIIKFFPAEQSGGVAYLKAIAPVYPKLRFMPTGGINAKNLCDYLSFDKIVACGGSWMVNSDLLDNDRFDEITALCAQAMHSMLGFTLAHVGINAAQEEQAQKAAAMFETLFGFAVKDGTSSVFAGTGIEVMKQPYHGTHGHIAIGTNHVARAKAYLEKRGFTFNEDTAKYTPAGKLNAIYLQDEICGFAVHLVGKAK